MGFDRDEVLIGVGMALCIVGLLGVAVMSLSGTSRSEERGLVAVTLDGPSRVLAIRADGARRVVIASTDGKPIALVEDVPRTQDEWVEGERRSDGTWHDVVAHVHAKR